ncbi:TPA: low molecular weight phosphotyrosine protein phosphatase, partial [Streptococcus suis]|nr:low molecular weight phosphotyrosine protein phosphatase [Streptococcus suis]
MKKIVFVCLGNICRSPMAEFVMKDMTSQFHIESRATSNWEHGNPIYSGT